MNNGSHSLLWRPRKRFVALVAFAALVSLPALPAAAHGSAHDEPYDMDFNCELGSALNSYENCVIDINGDGVEDCWISDSDGDGIYDTSALDTDFDGRAETFYTIIGSPFGEVYMRYDHDGDLLFDDEEYSLYDTDPYRFDTDGDGYGDNLELIEGSNPLDPWCTPYGCG